MIKLMYETPETQEFATITSCTVVLDDERTLDEMFEAYASFLRAIGYQIPIGAYVQITEDEV